MGPDDEESEGEVEGADTEKLRSLAEDAFGGEWSDDQLLALKELIHSCVEGGY
jgi:hypothetical protein